MTAILCVLLSLYISANAIAPLHLSTKDPVQNSYIVVFQEPIALTLLKSDFAYFATYHKISFKYTYDSVLKGFAATMDKDQLMAVRNHPRVKYVEQDQKVHVAQGKCTSYDCTSWGLSRVSYASISLNSTYAPRFPNLGAGVTVYVIDTGVFVTHNDFQGRAVFGFKAEDDWSDTDRNGHGTHVASTTAGSLYGLAKNADVIAVKVLGDDGSGTTSGVIAGIQFAAKDASANKRRAVGNMSLGGGFSTALNNAVSIASTGDPLYPVPMVVAAGNDNNDACQTSPASADYAITIGASTTDGLDGKETDLRSTFSNSGTCVDLLAPGTDITGAWIGSASASRTISGTSMASPHVAGAAALLIGENPSMNNFETLQSELVGNGILGEIELNCADAWNPSTCQRTPNIMLFVGCW